MILLPSFNQLQVDLLVGTLLGDGNLQNVGQSWRYRVVQKTAHIDYVNFKYGILKDFVNTPPKIQQVKDKNGKETSRCVFNTLSSSNFDVFANLFYKKNTENNGWIKQVPENISTYLTPTAIAFWYMDDGALKWQGKSNAVRFCTDSFSHDEVILLQNALAKFNIETTLQKQRNTERICSKETSYEALASVITPYLIPSMYYKFPDGNKGIFHSEQIGRELYDFGDPVLNVESDSTIEDPDLMPNLLDSFY